mgnify:CR=1 FL=1
MCEKECEQGGEDDVTLHSLERKFLSDGRT